jgi:DNA-binding IclR family transcriptional regulator
MADAPERAAGGRVKRAPQNHRTVDRVTRILEEVVYKPGMTFAELVRALGAAKSSVYGFIGGLLANGWLYEEQGRFYLGPAVYALTIASGHIRAGMVNDADLAKLHNETGVAVFLGAQAGDHLIYIAEAGSDPVAGFEARSNIRRTLLVTAGGKALLAARPPAEIEAYLRRRGPEEAEQVNSFLAQVDEIRRTGIATNVGRTGRLGIATVVRNRHGEAVATVTFVGPVAEIEERTTQLGELLLKRSAEWAKRSLRPREAI